MIYFVDGELKLNPDATDLNDLDTCKSIVVPVCFLFNLTFFKKTPSVFIHKDGELKLKEKFDKADEFDENIDDEHDVCKFIIILYFFD